MRKTLLALTAATGLLGFGAVGASAVQAANIYFGMISIGCTLWGFFPTPCAWLSMFNIMVSEDVGTYFCKHKETEDKAITTGYKVGAAMAIGAIALGWTFDHHNRQ